jgi:hypothetical protein
VLVLGTAPASPPIPSPLPHGISTAAKWLQYVRSLHPSSVSTSASQSAGSVDRSSHNAHSDTDNRKHTAHSAGERSPFRSLSEDGVGVGTEGGSSETEGGIYKGMNKVLGGDKGSGGGVHGEKQGEGEGEGEVEAANSVSALHGSDGKDTDVASASASLTGTDTATATGPAERATTEVSQLIVTHHADDVNESFYSNAITAIPEDDFAERTVRAAELLHLLQFAFGTFLSSMLASLLNSTCFFIFSLFLF